MTPLVQVLKSARALYAANPSHAPRGILPSGPSVCPVQAIDQAATEGRLWADPPRVSIPVALEALIEATGGPQSGMEQRHPRGYIIDWNARTTTSEVLAAFDRAIKTAHGRSD